MKIKLEKKQYDYLIYKLREEDLAIDFENKIEIKNGFVYLNLNNDLIDEIRDWAGDQQQKDGYDENYELNEEGQILEDIIDCFYLG